MLPPMTGSPGFGGKHDVHDRNRQVVDLFTDSVHGQGITEGARLAEADDRILPGIAFAVSASVTKKPISPAEPSAPRNSSPMAARLEMFST
jgi:hypothetical protein